MKYMKPQKMTQLKNSRSDMLYQKKIRLLIAGVITVCVCFIALIACWNGFILPKHDPEAEQFVSDLSEQIQNEKLYINEGYEIYLCMTPIYKDELLTVNLVNCETNNVDIQLMIRDIEGNKKAVSGLLYPGEMLQKIRVDNLTDKAIQLEVVAYEQNTHYSAGVVRVKTEWKIALED